MAPLQSFKEKKLPFVRYFVTVRCLSVLTQVVLIIALTLGLSSLIMYG